MECACSPQSHQAAPAGVFFWSTGSAREPISLPSRLNPRCCCPLSAESDDDCLHHAVHERLGELLRVLKIIISKHQSLNSVDILSTAGTVIATVKGEPQIRSFRALTLHPGHAVTD